MRIEPKAFLAIEKSMAAAMHAEWDRLSGSILKELHGKIAARDWAGAETLANNLTLKGVVTKVRPRLEELALSAILFGAHRVTGSVKTTHFAKNKVIPKELHAAIDQMEHAVEHDASDYGRNQLHAKIAELKRLDERAHMQKDDVSDEQLAQTGGLQEPEQGQRKKGKRKLLTEQDVAKRVFKGGKTLYVHRELKNTDEFLAWARGQGFKTTVPADDLHVTLCYSKTPLDWPKPDTSELIVPADTDHRRSIEQFGKGAVVLSFPSEALSARNAALRAAGATSDYEGYAPHVTITYDLPDDVELADIDLYDGPLVFGPEVYEQVKGFDPATDLDEEVLKAEFDLTAALNDAVDKGGKVAINLGATLTTSRLVTLGFLSQAKESGRKTYQVDEVLDDRTCPVCMEMNGTPFDVDRQYDRTLQALGTADPQDLKEIAPWPGLDDVAGGDPDELQGQGYGAPPYHPGCRGMLSLVDEVEVQVPATEGEDDGALGTESDSDGTDASAWDDGAIQQLGWDRFNVTDPEVFSDVDEAFEAGDYDQAQALIDDWKIKNVEKEDQFDGPNAPKRKRRNQTPAGRTMDHDDIRADSSSIAFDSGVSNDANAPLET